MKVLLRAYPRRWRERYGEELLALLEAEPLTWRLRANVLQSALGERLRALGPPPLRVLWAWSLFVIGGMAFQKTSEHWGAAVPAGDRGIPTAAFDTVATAAAIGSAAVLVAIALALPAFLSDMRRGGWPFLRRAILVASSTTVVAAAALISLAHDHDIVAGSVFVAFAIFSLFAWTHAATAAARRIQLHRAHTALAHLVTATMVVMTLAAATWFASMSIHAPTFVGAAQLGVVAAFMIIGTTLAGTGAIPESRT